MEIGRVCRKLVGREVGRTCVVVEEVDKNFVIVDSPTVKRRRCNIRHLDPTNATVKIKKGATKKDIEKALEKVKLPAEE